ncbi:hypothetical protein G6O69_01750 [Pseudenhygromyxa sp. WMMC2535]|uniref:hypothetical protein n=1 Tax=Pseudenhygromyxa sp. WMMC2535 TaxID=2712867 RepID=UPI001552B0CC|nr:hypothetical protein [Pseudenhygromyxa sp. WMMC2535]NVB36538.1 hypothetical protein [Pseudenhygromyxa sp. WMMC2535]
MESSVESSQAQLAARMLEALEIDSAEDFFAAKELLELAVAAMPIDGRLPTDAPALAGFRLAQAMLFQLRGARPGLGDDGVLWRGRPSFLTPERFAALEREFATGQARAVHDRWGQHLAKGGPVVEALLHDPELVELVSTHVGPLSPQRQASCIYYDSEGAHIRPHIDTDRFCINANLLVSHEGERRSSLVVYPLAGEPRLIALEPGELVLFHADCVVHARTPLGPEERVWALSLGYQPEGEFHR